MQTIYLDISNKGVVPTVYAKQGDVGRKFLVVLTDSGIPYSLPAGSVFSVWYEGDSGEGNYTDIGEQSAFSINENAVTVEMIEQMLSVAGNGILCLTLNKADGGQIGSWNIPYVCERIPGFESEEATSYYTAFSETVKNLQKMVETDPTVPSWAKEPKKPTYTAAEVGAAPAGYGLGEGSPYPPNNSVDEAVLNGWYYIAPSMTGAPSVPGLNSVGYGALLVINRAELVTQEYYVEPHTGIGVYAIKLVRQKNNTGAWTEWEWVNPPMAVGIEYRTTERFEGKPVYAKLVDFGTLPNATYKTVSLGTTNGQKIVYCHAVTSTGAALPYTDTSSTAAGWMMRVKNANASAVTIETTGNYSTLTVCVFVKYTKATD